MDGSGMVPLGPERHGARYWRRFTSYAFARTRRAVPIVLGEHEQVAASLPLLFAQSQTGPQPVALLRLAAVGESALIAPSGVWLGSYVPSLLRVHPFGCTDPAAERMALLVDEDSGLITDDPADEPFFTPEGAPAPALEEVIAFFSRRADAERRTRAACAALHAQELLIPFRPPSGTMDESDVAGFAMIDRARLEGIGRIGLATLHRAGALGLAYAHFVSLGHLAFLAHVERRAAAGEGAAPATGAPPPRAPADDRLSGFLDALADAQRGEDDASEGDGPIANRARERENGPRGDTGG